MSGFDRALAGLVPVLPRRLVGRVARRYIAGPQLADALETVRTLADTDGCVATLDVLGEHVHTAGDAQAMTDAYRAALGGIQEQGLPCGISVKLSSLGLGLGRGLCAANLDRVLETAASASRFVRIDMEEASTVQPTLDLVVSAHAQGRRVGAVLQARLRRTPEDLQRLIEARVSVRLVKGIYLEPARIAYTGFDEIQEAYLRLLEQALQGGLTVAVATHDDRLVREAVRLLRQHSGGGGDHELQLLLGVREDLRRGLRAEGWRVRVYVPYGRDWFAYSLRRLQENPRMATQIAKAMIGLR